MDKTIVSIVLAKPLAYKNFDCGVDVLNRYLKQFAKKNDTLNVGRTYVLLDSGCVSGFYTVSMGEIRFESLTEESRKKLPRYPLPVVRIGRLAVDKDMQGKGFGRHLLMDALFRAWRVSQEIALFSVVVDAKDESAKNFYLRYGFVPYSDRDFSLFLPITTIQKLFQ
ncbi:MAG: GNAT family N-acetyltransferase [bacterium]